MKAVIVDLLDGFAAALDETGAVVKIPDAGYEIGQSIELGDSTRHRAGESTRDAFEVLGGGRSTRETSRRRDPLRMRGAAAAAAAAVVLALGAGTGYAYTQPYGTVSLDVNPSIEYTVNRFDVVIDVQAINDEGEAVLAQLDMKQLRNHRVDKAVAVTVEQIERDGYLDEEGADVLISAGTRNDAHSERLRQELEGSIEHDMGIPTRSVSLTPEQVERAHENGMTGGRQWELDNMQPTTPGDITPSNGGAAVHNSAAGGSHEATDQGVPSGDKDSGSPGTVTGVDQSTAPNVADPAGGRMDGDGGQGGAAAAPLTGGSPQGEAGQGGTQDQVQGQGQEQGQSQGQEQGQGQGQMMPSPH